MNKSSIVSVTDSKGTIIYANDKFCEISKFSREELLGKNHRILKSGFHSPEFYKEIWNTISNGNVWQGLIKNKSKDGSFYWVATSIVPFFDKKNNIFQYMSIRQDITKQIELENELLQKEKLSIIGELAARLTHDLRNPLSIIQMTIENLKELYGTDEKKQIFFEKIERSIDRITHQVDNVLDFIKENPNVCGTVIVDGGYVMNECAHEYESVVIRGTMSIVEDTKRKKHAIGVLLNHLEENPDIVRKNSLKDEGKYISVGILKLAIEEISGKKGR